MTTWVLPDLGNTHITTEGIRRRDIGIHRLEAGGPEALPALRPTGVVIRPTLILRAIFYGSVIRLVQPMTPETGEI